MQLYMYTSSEMSITSSTVQESEKEIWKKWMNSEYKKKKRIRISSNMVIKSSESVYNCSSSSKTLL